MRLTVGHKVAEKPKIVTRCGSPRCVDIMAVSSRQRPADFLRRLHPFGQSRRLAALTDARGVQLLLGDVGEREVGAREVSVPKVGVREVGAREVGVREDGAREVGDTATAMSTAQSRRKSLP